MNRRKLLKLLVLLGEVAGLIFVSFPFLQSTSPAAHLPEAYKEIDISDMNPSSLKMVVLRESKKVEKGTSTAYYYGEALLAVRGESGDYYSYWLPIWENKVLMPYRVWGQHEGYCPELKINKLKNETSTIYCQDPSWDENLTKQWYWSIDGKNLGDDLPDLVSVRHRISAGVMHAFYR